MTSDEKPRVTVRELVVLSLLAALMFVGQVALAALPNIEPVTLILMACTLVYGWKTLLPMYVFVVLEGLIYGFSLWWIGYLYVWLVIVAATRLLRGTGSYVVLAVAAGVFGLMFGALFAIMDVFIGGAVFAFTKWVAGIGFDLMHCVSNFVISLALLKPVHKLLLRLQALPKA